MEEIKIDRTKPVYTLSIASQLSNIPAHSIRQYIDKGLIIPYKLDSSRHLFSIGDIDRLRNIRKMINNNGLNFAGIKTYMAMVPCWAIQGCPENDRQSCKAFYSDTLPCWEASEKGKICKNEDCRECTVYKCLSDRQELKSTIRNLI